MFPAFIFTIFKFHFFQLTGHRTIKVYREQTIITINWRIKLIKQINRFSNEPQTNCRPLMKSCQRVDRLHLIINFNGVKIKKCFQKIHHRRQNRSSHPNNNNNSRCNSNNNHKKCPLHRIQTRTQIQIQIRTASQKC